MILPHLAAGRQRVERLFPDEAHYTDRRLPTFFTPLAEAQNGRAAMLGLLALVGYEAVKGSPFF